MEPIVNGVEEPECDEAELSLPGEPEENESTVMETKAKSVAMPANNGKVEAIMFIYASINAAQQAKSGFSMDDCERIFEARNTLLEFFSKHHEPTQASFDACTIFDNACQFQQRQGAFSIEGSYKLKQYLSMLKKATSVVQPAKQQGSPRGQPQGQQPQPQGQNRGQQRSRGRGKGGKK